MASNTPNLNLLKKDPVTDGNDTFNIETMLNENWDKIDAAVGDVREELQDIEIPDASLTQTGIVQLSNETNGSRENVAATEKAVSQAFQAGNERKAEVVAALVALGVSASTSETWAQLIPKMATIVRATGNADVREVLSGKTFSIGSASGLTGTMVNQGANFITPGTSNKLIPSGYHNGSGFVVGDAELIAANIRADKNIFGVQGSIPLLNPDYADQRLTTNLSIGLYSGDGAEYVYFGVPSGQILNGVNWIRHPKIALMTTMGLYKPLLIGSKVFSPTYKGNHNNSGRDVNRGVFANVVTDSPDNNYSAIVYHVPTAGNFNTLLHVKNGQSNGVADRLRDTFAMEDSSKLIFWHGYSNTVSMYQVSWDGSRYNTTNLVSFNVAIDSYDYEFNASIYNNEIIFAQADINKLSIYRYNKSGVLLGSKNIVLVSTNYAPAVRSLPDGKILIMHTYPLTYKGNYDIYDRLGNLIERYSPNSINYSTIEGADQVLRINYLKAEDGSARYAHSNYPEGLYNQSIF